LGYIGGYTVFRRVPVLCSLVAEGFKMANCPLCKDQSSNVPDSMLGTIQVDCGGCGKYKVTDSALEALRDGLGDPNLASWVYQQNTFGITPQITREVVQSAKAIQVPNTERRTELFLKEAILALNGELSGLVDPTDRRLKVASWSRSD